MLKKIIGALSTVLIALPVSAGVVDINVSGVMSWDGQGDADNTVLALDLGAGAVIDGLGWDVTITPNGASWYSEATALFTDSGGGQGINVSPGAGAGFADDGVPLAFSSGGILDLTDNGIADIVLADGILLLEFYDSFDDVADAVDAVWGGTLSVSCTGSATCDGVVSAAEPGILLLFGLGLIGVVVARRRS